MIARTLDPMDCPCGLGCGCGGSCGCGNGACDCAA